MAYTKERNTRHIKEIEELANKRKQVKHRKEYGQRQVTTHPHKQRIPNTQTKQEEIEEIQQNKKRLTTQKIKNTHQSTDKETTKHQYTSQYTTRRHNTKPYQTLDMIPQHSSLPTTATRNKWTQDKSNGHKTPNTKYHSLNKHKRHNQVDQREQKENRAEKSIIDHITCNRRLQPKT